MTPDRIGPYRVISRLGSGGMGEVFVADDSRLDRRVAIKRVRPDVVDRDSRRRLLVEARAAARLDHPNICAIYEVGDDDAGPYIVMPLVEGDTLATRLGRGPLSVPDAVSVATQIADALTAAHARGILHRDIKPANVMVSARGQARVMDFGLAKQLPEPHEPSSAAETLSRLTREGSVVGTAAYMSPEQARGETVDARSDLFSLGIVLHEMVTGQRPFGGASMVDTLSEILTRDPVPLGQLRPGVPEELSRIVAKLLRKNREERYQSAADVLVDLRALLRAVHGQVPAAEPTAPTPIVGDASSISSSPRPIRRASLTLTVLAVLAASTTVAFVAWRVWGDRPSAEVHIESLAVLPLDSLSRDASQDYVAAAMTEELTRALAGIKSLRVISRTSTEQFRGAKPNMPAIARALGVDGLIEGSVVRDGDHIRITAQLIHGPTDRHLWASAYDGDLRDVLALERRVAEAIAGEVRAAVTPTERQTLHASRSVDPRAMDLYLKAHEHFYAGTGAAEAPDRRTLIATAIGEYQQALVMEPQWADAYGALAVAQHWHSDFDESRRSALTAIQLDDTVAAAHMALGYVSAAYDWDLVRAEREFRRALALSPSSSSGSYAMLLSALGRHDEARAMWDHAVTVDPVLKVSVLGLGLVAQSLEQAGDFDGASRLVRQIIPLNASAAHARLAQIALYRGRPDDALVELRDADETFQSRALHAIALARLGRTAEARAALQALELDATPVTNAYYLAAVYVSLGDRAKTFAALEHCYAGKRGWLPFLNVDHLFDDVRTDPRFQDLLKRVGISATR